MKICVECRHHRGDRAGDALWHDHRCGATTLKPMQDPVTGQHGYSAKNDLGSVYMTDERHPYCRDINPKGKCGLFEEMS